MEESVDVLTFLLGGEIEITNSEKPRETSKSHSSKKGEITTIQRELILERNQLDLALYKFVQKQLNLTKTKLLS